MVMQMSQKMNEPIIQEPNTSHPAPRVCSDFSKCILVNFDYILVIYYLFLSAPVSVF